MKPALAHPTPLALLAFTTAVTLTATLLSASALAAAAPPKTSVSVLRFDQEVGKTLEDCSRWEFTSQNQMQSELERELSLQGLRVLERRQIRTMLGNEFDLPNVNKKTVAKRNQFVAAKYSITAAITEMGICESSSNTGVSLGGLISMVGGPDVDLSARHRSSVSKIKVIAQIVSVETGEIVKSVEARSEVTSGGFGVEGGYHGVGASRGTRSNAPYEKATNAAIRDLADQIATTLRKG